MVQARNGLSLFCLAIFSLFTVSSFVWAEDWKLFGQTASGDIYYDKSSITEEGNIVRVWTKEIYYQDGKINTYEILKSLGRAIATPDMLSHQLILREYDCANEKMQSTSLTVYTVEGTSVFSQRKSYNEWNDTTVPTLVEQIRLVVVWVYLDFASCARESL